MGEPSLWNVYGPNDISLNGELCFNPSWESRPCGTHPHDPTSRPELSGFNPSWESRPCGTNLITFPPEIPPRVSTPHGRAVPVELLHAIVNAPRGVGFNPSWESRPCGTSDVESTDGNLTVSFNPSWESRPCGTNHWNDSHSYPYFLFQPLMGEPSLWNLLPRFETPTAMVFGFNPSWESRPCGTGSV